MDGWRIEKISALHASIDKEATVLEEKHRDRLQCGKGCHGCCVDDLTVFQVEADRILACCGDVLKEDPHPHGRCAFLDGSGACRIYAHRPYVCRTQGLPLRWIQESQDGNWVEYRDICILNEDGEPIEELPEEDCWSLGPYEGALARLQREKGDPDARIALRSLFAIDV